MRWMMVFTEDADSETDLRAALSMLTNPRDPNDRLAAGEILARSAGKIHLLDSGPVPK